MANSSDFSDVTQLDSWALTTPSGSTATWGNSVSDGYLVLDTPDGTFDAWNTNGTARAMQAVQNADFAFSSHFLTVPDEQYEMQGLLVEQDASNWIRFDTFSDGNKLFAFAAVTINGTSTKKFQVEIPPDGAPYLRMERIGNTWTCLYSVDNENWTVAGVFEQSLAVSQAGVFAGNLAGSNGFAAQVDWIAFDDDPLLTEDAGYADAPPVAADDTLATAFDTALVLDVADLLANDSDPEGAALTVTQVSAAQSGTLTDNGDGTLTYVPADGFVGTDSFGYTVSDGTHQTTATVNITVGEMAVSGPESDDFSAAALGDQWTITTPGASSWALDTSGSDAFLSLITPDGTYDAWGTNTTARAMQAMDDTDFTVETRFLSTPDSKYELQGFLIEEDADTWLRFDTYSDGSKLYAFAAFSNAGSNTVLFQQVIQGGTAPFLRLERSGDTWTFLYSQDGSSWTLAGTTTRSIAVSDAGVFAGNLAGSNGFTALVDYIEFGSDPLTAEDGSVAPPNAAPTAEDDQLVTAADTALIFDQADLLENDSDPDGSTLSIVEFGPAQSGSLTDNGDGTLTYTPNAGFAGSDSFDYTVSDGALQTTATVSVTVGSTPQSTGVSDDFSASEVSGVWTGTTPGSGAIAPYESGSESAVALTATGAQDPWGQNMATRLMQAIDNVDVSVTTRFLSTPDTRYETQGFLVEEDQNSWLRFDTYFDGTNLRAFAALTLNGTPTVLLNTVLAVNAAPYLQLTRTGDIWQFAYSQDGNNWSVAGTATAAIDMTAIGVMAGNVTASNSFTAIVDWFEVATDPLLQDDGLPFDQSTPVAVDDAFTTQVDALLAVDAASGVLSNDTDADGDTLTASLINGPQNGTLTFNTDGSFTYSPNAGFVGYDTFVYSTADSFGATDTASVALTVGTPPNGYSDDFSGGSLSGFWTAEGPAGTTAGRGITGPDGVLELRSGNGTFDAYGTNTSGRLMQDVLDQDIQFTARFLSVPTGPYQLQGFLFEQDAGKWVRLDVYSDKNGLHIYGAHTTGGTTNTMFNTLIDPAQVEFMRAGRQGDVWTLEYSENGSDWTVAGSFTFAMELNRGGLFAGNLGASTGFTAVVDWFETNSDPILGEDANVVPQAVDDVLFVLPDTTTLINTATDLLANDQAVSAQLDLVSIGSPSSGTLIDNGDGTLSFTPDAGFLGDITVSYVMSADGQTDTAELTLTVQPPSISDDFADGVLDPAWSFSGIGGSGTEGSVGSNGVLQIVSPRGLPVSASDVLTSPRVLQDQPDTDFQISAGFLTEPEQAYQEHGLLVIQDAENWIRFDMAFTNSGLVLIVGVIEGGQTTYPLFQSIDSGDVTDFRISRDGSNWLFETSDANGTWTTAFTMTHDMEVTQVGLFSGSTSFDSNVPGYTALVDYFENAMNPLVNEDSVVVPANFTPITNDDTAVVDGLAPTIIDVSDLLANDTDSNGDTLTVTGIIQPDHGSLVDNGDGTLTYTPTINSPVQDNFSYTVSDGTDTSSADVRLIVGNPITVWEGSQQSFGSNGEGQQFINVLGNVDAVVTGLSYTLNGGAVRQLSIGADTRRLQDTGDFNIDIRYSALDGSAADDIILITATTELGDVFTQEVVIDYEDGIAWDPNYAIDWSTQTNVSDAVQIADGRWEIGPDGLRPTQLGYDRVVVMGDAGWDNYQLNTTITMHDLLNSDPRGRDGGGFAIGMLWTGHTNDPISGFQPLSGWEPGAAFFYTDKNGDGTGRLDLHPSRDFFSELNTMALSLDEGATYNFTVQVEQVALYDRLFSVRIWEEGTAEPEAWTMQGVQTFDISDAPQTGSVYFNAHYFDVSFGDVTVTEITGSDILQGTEGDDTLMGVDLTAALPGAGERDVAAGYAGEDTFVMGDANGVFYDDGVAASSGIDDFLYVWDFSTTEDILLLHGIASDYFVEIDAATLPEGAAIWLTGDTDSADELIGILGGLTEFDLNAENVSYSGLFA
ncbi:cadherin-like domain-containing protein [Sulfitobacter sp. S223]|uniref:cadherin-like domain-containing protein n=1 Tax=Sulfitobacter sp. S223 TaxID=2867023 RepID=UPI0021A89C0D|nr:cadherin-like domain-containing protein [Sulfitobacter sp. S223]UWR25823.1 cadherin-like domain-containing protein [Sulfitobacter sp. S223]